MQSKEIDFDLDLREIQGQERLDEFCDFLQTLGRHLGKPVLMGDESGHPAEHPVLGFFVATDRVAVIDPLAERAAVEGACETSKPNGMTAGDVR
jgi:hypothetical protein